MACAIVPTTHYLLHKAGGNSVWVKAKSPLDAAEKLARRSYSQKATVAGRTEDKVFNVHLPTSSYHDKYFVVDTDTRK